MFNSPATFDLNGIRVRRPRKGRPQDTADTVDEKDSNAPFRHLAVCPFTIVIDSREQLPYTFDGMDNGNLIVPTVVAGLPSGDYSIEGMEDRIAIERKSLDDLYGSVTWGRERFEKEILRLDVLGKEHYDWVFSAVVIEATWPEIMSPGEWRPGWINQTEPRSVEGTIVAWSIRYPRVHWWACGSRRQAEQRTFSILRKFWEQSDQPSTPE